MQFNFGDKREAHLLDESVLPVTEKERRGEGKSSIGTRMKWASLLMICVSIFHPTADATCPLSPPFFLSPIIYLKCHLNHTVYVPSVSVHALIRSYGSSVIWFSIYLVVRS